MVTSARLRWGLLCALAICTAAPLASAEEQWLTFQGGDGPGKGKHIVLVSGDEEYRSEEGLTQLAKILSKRHGFDCRVLFAIDPKTGLVDPDYLRNIPGLEALKDADLMIIQTRFRDLPDEQMKHVIDYLNAGKPVIGLRTATHPFSIPPGRPYSKYSWNSKEPGWQGGFGRRILGETWVSHWGSHKVQSTRGIIAPGQENNPIVRGCDDIWGPMDVYEVHPGKECTALVLGQVLTGTQPNDPPLPGPKNNPMMPVAWTRQYEAENGKTGRAFTTTMGAAVDLANDGVRRMLVNASYWAVGLADKIPGNADVSVVGDFRPSAVGVHGYRHGLKPQDFAK